MTGMTYRAAGSGGRAELEQAVAAGEALAICEAMVAVAFNDDDWQWAQTRFVGLSEHPHSSVRALAATCLGHVARIHNRIDRDVVLPVLDRLFADPATRGYAETAREDVDMFAPGR